MKKIALFAGTRPEVIKLAPIYLALKKEPGFEVQLISTGQHASLLETALNDFGIVPEISLNSFVEGQTLNDLSSLLIKNIGRTLINVNPDLVIVQGDTSTSVMAAIASYNNRIPVAHVEAGLRSFNKKEPFPEEVNRKIITQIADLHFAPTSSAFEQLLLEGVDPGIVYCTGNTGIDSLFWMKDEILNGRTRLNSRIKRLLQYEDIVLLTTHRRENFGENLDVILRSIKKISQHNRNVQIIFPVHPNPSVRGVVIDRLTDLVNVHIVDPLSFAETVAVLMKVRFVITDSGGLQEEAPSLNRRVIVLRNSTEREEAVSAGFAVLTGANEKQIVDEFNSFLKRPVEDLLEKHLFGDGKSAFRIIEIIKEKFTESAF